MINLFDFMIFTRKTPFHFRNAQRTFDLNEAVTLNLKSMYAFHKVYSLVDGRNKMEREKAIQNILKIGKKTYDERQYEVINGITKTLRSVDILSHLKAEDYIVKDINLVIPFVSHAKGQELIVCVKTTRNASESFESEIIREKHYVETALMRQAVGSHYDCFMLAVEVDNPHAFSFFRIDNSLLEQGDIEISEKLSLLNECNSQNFYPSYFNGGAKLITKPNYL